MCPDAAARCAPTGRRPACWPIAARGTGRRKRCAAGSRASWRRDGAQRSAVASRTDRAVFRFLARACWKWWPRAPLPADATTSRVFAQFEPGLLAPGGRGAGRDHAAFRVAFARPGAAGPGLAARSDLDACGFGQWRLVAAATCATGADRPRPAGGPVAGVVPLGRGDSAVSRDMAAGRGLGPALRPSSRRSWSERMMNYAMAEGTSASRNR
jgi:hypothetical protein